MARGGRNAARQRKARKALVKMMARSLLLQLGANAPARRTRCGKHRPVRSVAAASLGAVATGALSLGAGAVGAIAVGRLAIKRGAIGSLSIEELKVSRLSVQELTVVHDSRSA